MKEYWRKIRQSARSPRAITTILIGVVTSVFCLGSASAQSYSFANFTWDQSDTPDVAFPLALGVIPDGFGAIITGIATGNHSITGFPSPPAMGFDPNLSLGSELFGGNGVRYVNLPLGNDGAGARSGIEITWSAGRSLENLPGVDFVVFESGSSGGPEAMMVQVRRSGAGTWTKWYHAPAVDFQLYSGPTEGAFAYAYDLTNLGVNNGQRVDRIRVVNMRTTDRMETGGTGFVIPEDAGFTSQILPHPGPLFTGQPNSYPLGSYDPDPLYVAALHTVDTGIACGNGVVESGEECDDGNNLSGDCCSPTCTIDSNGTPCSDGVFCNGSDSCSSGVCSVHAGNPCPGPDGDGNCSESCDEGNASCTAADPDETICDDGDSCTTDDHCTAGVCSGPYNPVVCLHPLQCYRTSRNTPQPSIDPVVTIDRFINPLDVPPVTVGMVRQVRGLCAPASVNGNPAIAPNLPGHLAVYPMTLGPRKIVKGLLPVRNLQVNNALGSARFDARRAVSLLVPTAESQFGIPDVLDAPVPDHFTCYSIRRAAGQPLIGPLPSVTVGDQFATVNAKLLRPWRLCAPTDKNGESPGAQSHPGYLMCYRVRRPFQTPGRIFIRNQFSSTPLVPNRYLELCLPSTVSP